jgi:hypothetical protein
MREITAFAWDLADARKRILAANKREKARMEAEKWRPDCLLDSAEPQILFALIRVHSWLNTFHPLSG